MFVGADWRIFIAREAVPYLVLEAHCRCDVEGCASLIFGISLRYLRHKLQSAYYAIQFYWFKNDLQIFKLIGNYVI
jgi:hypothetical protein